uniref:HTH La-type RNA-binding domain-containing protein n=1 Tax=Compsopogon caeruleus TaxID=31354 RepID=A0A7S1TCP9_9RHOD|mmetsp:Transcript_14121/g.28878  ORF Transcript_14121/g.28878 Transcript_14121/m.28878 type:complete len:629 (+) Transcript_14121:111-1997(+)
MERRRIPALAFLSDCAPQRYTRPLSNVPRLAGRHGTARFRAFQPKRCHVAYFDFEDDALVVGILGKNSAEDEYDDLTDENGEAGGEKGDRWNDWDWALNAILVGPDNADSRYEILKRQLEFWFCDANLRRDSHLRDRMDNDGWVDIRTLMDFNRTSSIGVSVEEWVTVARDSENLEWREREQSLFEVRSTKPMVELNEPDEDEAARSIVAHSLSTALRRPYVLKMFLQFGEIEYHSIPRTRVRRILEPTVIIYKDKASAERCIRETKSDPSKHDLGHIPACIICPFSEWTEDKKRALRNESSPLCTIVLIENIAKNITWGHVWSFCARNNRAIRYLDMASESSSAFARFRTRFEAEQALEELIDNKFSLGEYATARFLLRREERKFWMNCYTRKSQGKSVFEEGSVVRVNGIQQFTRWRDVFEVLCELEKGVFLTYDFGANFCYARAPTAKAAVHLANVLATGRVQIGDSVLSGYILVGDEEEEYSALIRERSDREGFKSRFQKVEGSRAVEKSVIRVEGIRRGTKWKELFDSLSAMSNKIFLAYEAGTDFCFVRASSPEAADDLIRTIQKSPKTISGSVVTATRPTDEDTDEFFTHLQKYRARSLEKRFNGHSSLSSPPNETSVAEL